MASPGSYGFQELDEESPSGLSRHGSPRHGPDLQNVHLRDSWGCIGRVAMPFFCDPESRRKAWCIAFANIFFILAFTKLMVSVSTLVKDFNNALEQKDEEAFYNAIHTMIWVSLLAIPLVAGHRWMHGCFALEWRRHITKSLLTNYIGDSQAYYRLKFQATDLDNPDQRIGQDVGDFTTVITELVATVFQAVMLIVAMSAVLFNISRQLFGFLIIFCGCMTFIVIVVFGAPLMTIQRQVLAKEGTLRFGLVRVRENAESIAFYQGYGFERKRCFEFFNDVLRTLYRRLGIMVTYHGVQQAAMLFASILPPLVLGPQYFRGEVEFGTIGQASMLFQTLLHSMMTLSSQMEQIANVGAQAVRVQQLRECVAVAAGNKVEELESAFASDSEGSSMDEDAIVLQHMLSPPLCLRLSQVMLQPPHSREPLLQGISCVLQDGDSMLIKGESGIGKSSLLRAIGGLWATGSGTIERCHPSECFFLPQAPYTCLGSLRENALYPSSAFDGSKVPTDKEIETVLAQTNIGHLATRYGLDTEADFDDVLSGGEKQRLSFARMLLRPKLRLAILDEATSALDEANEDSLYRLLKGKVPCFVSVGHRMNLERFHSHTITLTRRQHGGSTGHVVRRLLE